MIDFKKMKLPSSGMKNDFYLYCADVKSKIHLGPKEVEHLGHCFFQKTP